MYNYINPGSQEPYMVKQPQKLSKLFIHAAWRGRLDQDIVLIKVENRKNDLYKLCINVKCFLHSALTMRSHLTTPIGTAGGWIF